MSTANRQRGLSLLELLVALAIFAVIGAAGYGGLSSVLATRGALQVQAQRLAELQLAVNRLTLDIEQAVARPVRDEFGQPRPALIGDSGVGLDADGTLLSLTRSGWDNPLAQPRAGLQRLRYRLRDGALLRGYWDRLDRSGLTPLRETELLTGVSEVRLRFLTAERWVTRWPPAGAAGPSVPALPRAVEVRLLLDDWGELVRLLRLTGT